MDFNTNEFLDAFIEETRDNLENFSECIMELEKNKNDSEIVNTIFRVAHTLKGMAGSMGFEKMRSLTHTMEDLLSDVRDGKMKATSDLVDLLFKCHDYLEKALDSIVETSTENVEEPVDLIEDLKSLHANGGVKSGASAPAEAAAPAEEAPKKTAKKKKEEPADAPAADEAPASDDKSFEENTKIDETALDGFEFEIPSDINKEKGYKLTVNIDKDCKLLVARMFIVLKTVSDEAKLINSSPTMEQLSDMSFQAESNAINMVIECDNIDELLKKINQVPELDTMEAVSIANPEKKAEAVSERVDLTTFNPDQASGSNAQGESAQASEGGAPAAGAAAAGPHHVEEYLKIAASKVDNLADMVSELMITQSLIEQRIMLQMAEDQILTKEVPRMSRLTKDIQNLSMSLRMVPLKSTFQKVLRTGRDTAKTLEKEINIDVIGDETEIDRTITEKLYTPLMHMIRNSIGHGIESKEDRIKKGKDPVGSVTMSAYNKRGSVYIEIEDDGKGLDRDKILNKAIEKGIAQADKKYTDDDIYNFIFLPGFSTADKVDAVSGRGVGMDVVRTDITKVGGTVRVDTIPDQGTKFTLKIPINLAIMNGTIVKIKGETYILPTLNIREIVYVTDENYVNIKGKESMLKVRGEVIPIYPIKGILDENGMGREENDGTHAEKLMVITELDDIVRAIPVQEVLERREIVVKSLGSEFAHLDFLSGASILGDGTISLIFDIEGLFKKNADVC